MRSEENRVWIRRMLRIGFEVDCAPPPEGDVSNDWIAFIRPAGGGGSLMQATAEGEEAALTLLREQWLASDAWVEGNLLPGQFVIFVGDAEGPLEARRCDDFDEMDALTVRLVMAGHRFWITWCRADGTLEYAEGQRPRGWGREEPLEL